MKKMKKPKRIYLDHAAATPMDPDVLKTFVFAARKYTGNAHALHAEGVASHKALETARTQIAGVLGAHADELVFTSGATESNILAIQGVVRAAREAGIQNPHIIVSAIEHHSVLEAVRALVALGVEVDELKVDSDGLVDPRALRKLITPETVLVSVMYANNEIGSVEPLHEIAKEVRHARGVNASSYPYLHTDAAQATNYLDMNVLRLGVDLMTVSSGKTYGPYGIGALFVKRGTKIQPLQSGSVHEGGRRPGTEAVPLALAFAQAIKIAEKIKIKENTRVLKLRNMLKEKILEKIPDTTINNDFEHTLPNILSVTISGVESEALVIYLDAVGIAVAGRSSCATSLDGVSHVILAIGRARAELAGTIRFSLGRASTQEEISHVVKELPRVVALLRQSRNISK